MVINRLAVDANKRQEVCSINVLQAFCWSRHGCNTSCIHYDLTKAPCCAYLQRTRFQERVFDLPLRSKFLRMKLLLVYHLYLFNYIYLFAFICILISAAVNLFIRCVRATYTVSRGCWAPTSNRNTLNSPRGVVGAEKVKYSFKLMPFASFNCSKRDVFLRRLCAVDCSSPQTRRSPVSGTKSQKERHVLYVPAMALMSLLRCCYHMPYTTGRERARR